jgi:flagellar motor switch protein FliN/FliY
MMAEEQEDMTTATPPELSEGAVEGTGEIDLDLLMDVPVYLTEPMDLMVNGTLVARGEVVSAEGQFGLRLVDVVSPKERLQQLGS